jgi:F0F1-type ATP synthase alpha subunit
LSVTRVGRQTQPKELKDLSQKILSLLIKAQEFERFLRFGSEVTDLVKDVMDRGGAIWDFFKKNSYDAIPTAQQVIQVKKILGEDVVVASPTKQPGPEIAASPTPEQPSTVRQD